MSKYIEKFADQFNGIKCRDVLRWTKELKDAQNEERAIKVREDVLKQRRIAKEVRELL